MDKTVKKSVKGFRPRRYQRALVYDHKPPPSAMLPLYFKAWSKGLNNEEIHEEIAEVYDIDYNQFIKWTPFFFIYCKEQHNQGLFMEDVLEKTPEIEDTFIGYISRGMPMDKAAKIMNIPMPTLMHIWFEDKSFKTRVDYAVEMATFEVVDALRTRAIGYELEDVVVTETKVENAVSKDGSIRPPMTTTSKTSRVNHVPASVEAAKFYLINRSNGDFSSDGARNNEGDKGKILEALDKLTEITEEDKKYL